jgi:hypothetical protein
MNKNIKTLDVERIYGVKQAQTTLLSGIDTEGLTKTQKKKLKQKLKKHQQNNGTGPQ